MIGSLLLKFGFGIGCSGVIDCLFTNLILYTVVYAPFFAAIMFAVFGILKLAYKLRSSPAPDTKLLLVAIAFAGGSILLYHFVIGPAMRDHQKVEGYRRTARDFKGTIYQPGSTPDGYRLAAGGSNDEVSVYVFFEYRRPADDQSFLLLVHSQPDDLYLQPPFCRFSDIKIKEDVSFGGGGARHFSGPCERLTTPGGREIYQAKHGENEIQPPQNIAFADYGDTLIIIYKHELADRELFELFDSLEETSSEEAGFKAVR